MWYSRGTKTQSAIDQSSLQSSLPGDFPRYSFNRSSSAVNAALSSASLLESLFLAHAENMLKVCAEGIKKNKLKKHCCSIRARAVLARPSAWPLISKNRAFCHCIDKHLSTVKI